MNDSSEVRTPVGIVTGHRPASPLEFWVLVNESDYLQLDDIVVTHSSVPDIGEIKFYGIVSEVERYLEDSSLAMDTLLLSQGRYPDVSRWLAKVSVTRIEPEIFVPPKPSDPVYRVDRKGLEKALYFDNMEYKVPAGLTSAGFPAYINLDFLDGTKGAHISITGVSGVATKTSYATFLLYSLFRTIGTSNRKRGLNYKAIIFNLKGEDLLLIDKVNAKLRSEDILIWRKLGFEPDSGGFPNVRIYAPPKDRFSNLPDVSSSLITAQTYGWTMFEFASQKLLRFAFMDDKESRNLLDAISYVEMKLFELAEASKARGDRGPHLSLPRRKISSIEYITTLDDLYSVLLEDLDSSQKLLFRPNESKATMMAFLRRFERLSEDLGRLIGPDRQPPSLEDGDVIVIDIHSLTSKGQAFVTGAILYNLYLQKSEGGRREPVYFVLIDEMNKYAPVSGYTPIKDILLDIAERGRSLGLILIAAQQTASQVEPRILANCSVKLLGRMDPAEVNKPLYSYLSNTVRQRTTILKPGQLVLYQPDCPVPILIRFPMPIWATRLDEVKIDEPQMLL